MLLEKIKLEDGERIIIQTRRHWFVIAVDLGTILVGALIPLVLFFAAPLLLPENLADVLLTYTPLFWFGYAAAMLSVWIYTFGVFTNYYLDVLTLTDRRVIVIDQKGFFRRKNASFRLERLQDMNVEISGLIPTMLDFGTVHAETAGHGDEQFKVTNIPQPREFKAAVLAAADRRIELSQSSMEV